MPDFTLADLIAAQGGGGPVYEGGAPGNVTPADLLSYFNRLGQKGAQADVNLTQGIKDALTGAVLAPGRAATGAYDVTPEVPGQYSDIDEARRQLNEAHAGRSVFDLASLMIGAPGGSGGAGSGMRLPGAKIVQGQPEFGEEFLLRKDRTPANAPSDYGIAPEPQRSVREQLGGVIDAPTNYNVLPGPTAAQSANKDLIPFGDKSYWGLIVDTNTGRPISGIPYKTAADADFHHSMYVTPSQDAGLKSGRYSMVFDNGQGMFNWKNDDKALVEAVKAHLTNQDILKKYGLAGLTMGGVLQAQSAPPPQ